MVKIIAEPSGNHGGKLQNMLDLITYAYDSGANAFKPQCLKPENMALPGKVMTTGPWAGRDLFELYKEAQTPWDWFPVMKEFTENLGMEFMASAYCTESVDFVDKIGVSAIKIASFENNDLPLINYAISTKIPVIVSLGMADEQQFEAIAYSGARTLLCSSSYPASPSHYKLGHLRHPLVDGISDHTQGSAVACAAIALGARYIEKHITLSRDTIDGHFSEMDFNRFVQDCRDAEASVGKIWGPFPGEMTELRRSLWAICDIDEGEEFTPFNIQSLRPAGGLEPKMLQKLIFGRRAKRKIQFGEPITHDAVQ